jgi:DNA-binding GntR family transcriptional regulator
MQALSDPAEPNPAADPVAGKIARALEQDIGFGRLTPGQKLREENLSERFNASRHHVREALARLQQVGIVTHERNRGAFVRSFTLAEVMEIYDIREILQRQAALRIPLPVPEAAIDALSAIQAGYEAAVRGDDIQRIHTANDLFHTELFRLCGNEQLAQLVKHFMDLTYVIRAHSFREKGRLEHSRQHHQIMIDLLRGRDSWALAQICVDHMQPSKERYLLTLRERRGAANA